MWYASQQPCKLSVKGSNTTAVHCMEAYAAGREFFLSFWHNVRVQSTAVALSHLEAPHLVGTISSICTTGRPTDVSVSVGTRMQRVDVQSCHCIWVT